MAKGWVQDAQSPQALPASVQVRTQQRVLVLEWAKRRVLLHFDALRAQCPCAECRSARSQGRAVTVAPGVGIVDVKPCGPNAVQLVFSDGHERGIFPFEYLSELARRTA